MVDSISPTTLSCFALTFSFFPTPDVILLGKNKIKSPANPQILSMKEEENIAILLLNKH